MTISQFANQKYLNLESYRRNGQGVRTPLWFVEDGRVLYFFTRAQRHKVKRIGANPRVRVAPCDRRGNVTGERVGAAAWRLGADESRMADELLNRKYGSPRRGWIRHLLYHCRRYLRLLGLLGGVVELSAASSYCSWFVLADVTCGRGLTNPDIKYAAD